MRRAQGSGRERLRMTHCVEMPSVHPHVVSKPTAGLFAAQRSVANH